MFSYQLKLTLGCILFASMISACGGDDDVCSSICSLDKNDPCADQVANCKQKCTLMWEATSAYTENTGYKPEACAKCFVEQISYYYSTDNSECRGVNVPPTLDEPECESVCVDPAYDG